MREHRFRKVLILFAVTGVGACQAPDPYGEPAKWTFSGVNNANLAAMVDNPMDLVHGRSESHVPGQSAVIPIIRLRRDQVKTLPST